MAVCRRGDGARRVEPHLGEPADTTTQRAGRSGPRPTVPTPGCSPSCFLAGGSRVVDPPEHVLEFRPLGRPYVSLMDERCAWQQRIHAKLFHQGVPPVCALLTGEGCMTLATVELSTAGTRWRTRCSGPSTRSQNLSSRCAPGYKRPAPTGS